MGTISAAFWARVDRESGPICEVLGSRCWLWTGYRYHDRYGDFAFKTPDGRKHMAAHRVAWILGNKQRIPPGFEVCHRCDNPSCVNPAHLFAGSHSDNERDKVSKGRNVTPFSRVGESSLRAKLTDAQAVELRYLAKDPACSVSDLAARFGVSERCVYDVLRGHTFSHLPVFSVPRRRSKNSPACSPGQLRCSRCRRELPHAAFSRSTVARGTGWCRECQTRWYSERRQSNLESDDPDKTNVSSRVCEAAGSYTAGRDARAPERAPESQCDP